jgi:hypothetical protein
LSRLTDLRRLLGKPENIHEARMVLADQIGKITLVPKEGAYVAQGSVDFFGDMGLRVSGAGGPDCTTRRVPFELSLAA